MKRIAPAVMTIAAGAFLLAPSGVASAESKQQDIKSLEAGGNTVVDVSTEASDSTVVGRLQNNSSLTPQTALTKVGMGDVRVENLGPGEGRTVSMPFTPIEGLTTALVTVGTTSGFEGTYLVELDKDYSKPPLPLPLL